MIRDTRDQKRGEGKAEEIDPLLALAIYASANRDQPPPFPHIQQLPKNLSDLFNREEDSRLLLGGK
jgi:hypothetical protein